MAKQWKNGERWRRREKTYLLRNCSRPCLRSSMKESSNIPSSPRNGSCRIRAFPGRGGTTTWDKSHRKSYGISWTGIDNSLKRILLLIIKKVKHFWKDSSQNYDPVVTKRVKAFLCQHVMSILRLKARLFRIIVIVEQRTQTTCRRNLLQRSIQSCNIFLSNKKHCRCCHIVCWFDKSSTQQPFCRVQLNGSPCSPSPAPLWATRSRCTASVHKTPSVWRWAGWSETETHTRQTVTGVTVTCCLIYWEIFP